MLKYILFVTTCSTNIHLVLKIISIRDGLRTTHNLRPGKTHMNYTGNDCAWNPLERMKRVKKNMNININIYLCK